ncbi:MaoC/PaaZ C-terminal domain-containing protein [Conexibacter sp. SYSU D00693]|uniref:MaoC/PaaZ C-terminal domain-containing protein n=1 Tax=Conexibacter sp. SYSU D00693 TaxID=2812560 RepID=UPI00196B484B|nr:MaoC/PaaZ C-terminal domain-containing protein [Conexibacter sp. SYSU D00693]
MPIDVAKVVGAALPETPARWGPDDVVLYHLGVGAGDPPTDPGQLKWAYEQGLVVLPSWGVLPAMGTLLHMLGLDGMDVDLRTLLHGEQELVVHEPLPVEGDVVTTGRVVDVLDKGKAALVVLETETRAAQDGRPLCTNRFSAFFRGEGGFGGDAGPRPHVFAPDRPPDHVLRARTLPQQALLYRLTGDKNPLHADPAFATKAGFEQPILHGLCSFGIACRLLVDQVLGGDVTAVRRYGARFAGVLFPGEELELAVWDEGETLHAAARCVERDAPVLANVVLDRGERR